MASEKPASSVVLRRSVLGVRRADALRLIDELRAQVAQIAGTLRDTWNENQVLKRELAEVRGELERSLGASSGDRAAAEARAEAARLVAAAEEQAALVERQA